jgi:hypothetical protein
LVNMVGQFLDKSDERNCSDRSIIFADRGQ